MPLIECSVSSSATCPWKTGVLGIYKAKGYSINGVANNRQSRLEGKAEALISPENGRDFPLTNKRPQGIHSNGFVLCDKCEQRVASGVLARAFHCSLHSWQCIHLKWAGLFPCSPGRCCLWPWVCCAGQRAQGGTSSVLWGVEAPCGLSDDGFSLHASSSSWGALRHFP